MSAGDQSQGPPVWRLQWSPCGPRIAVVIRGRLAPADIPGLCASLNRMFEENDAAEVACDVGGMGDADAVTVDALAQLQLIARRHGRRVWLRNASCGLRELVAFAGLSDVLPVWSE